MRHGRPNTKLAAAFCIVALLAAPLGYADTLTESKVKAAYLYNFTKFIQWPPATFANGADPLTICTTGEQPFTGILGETLSSKSMDDRPLVARQIKADGELKSCQILFLSESDMSRHSNFLSALKPSGVLIVSEALNSKSTPNGGVMITFVRDSNRVRFRINNTAAEKAGLIISSRLLGLAISVE